MSKHIPQRMCVICRTKTVKGLLYRYTLQGEEAVFSPKEEGRGYYHCSNKMCKERFLSMQWYKKCKKGKK